MSVNKILLFTFSLFPLILFSQKEYDCFLLEDKGVTYEYRINNEEKTLAIFEEKSSFIIIFRIEQVEGKMYNRKCRNFKWLKDNSTYHYIEEDNEIIELNDFKNLIFIKNTNNCNLTKVYKVKRRIYEEY